MKIIFSPSERIFIRAQLKIVRSDNKVNDNISKIIKNDNNIVSIILIQKHTKYTKYTKGKYQINNGAKGEIQRD